tara:strand:+ start:1660 stop:1965 length:306 start_codon:yes stop_codon:yes gene_type:complete
MILIHVFDALQDKQNKKSELCSNIAQECYRIAAKGSDGKAFCITSRVPFGDPFMTSSRVARMTPNDYVNQGLRYEELEGSAALYLRTVSGLEAELERLSNI